MQILQFVGFTLFLANLTEVVGGQLSFFLLFLSVLDCVCKMASTLRAPKEVLDEALHSKQDLVAVALGHLLGLGHREGVPD